MAKSKTRERRGRKPKGAGGNRELAGPNALTVRQPSSDRANETEAGVAWATRVAGNDGFAHQQETPLQFAMNRKGVLPEKHTRAIGAHWASVGATYKFSSTVVTTRRPFFTPFVPRMRLAMV